MTSLLGWLDDPSDGTGIGFRRNGAYEHHSYRRIAGATLRVAGSLRDAGVRSGDVVSVVLPTGPGFVASFFGTLAAGATPNPIAPPALFADSAAYIEQTAHLLRTARPGAVLTDAAGLELVEEARRRADGGFPVLTGAQTERAAPLAERREPAGTALLQFTSGTSGDPRAVRVSGPNLEANLAGIAQWLGMRPGDLTASWLPVHHDMGLIGCLLTPVVTGTGVLALDPVDFIRSPLLWLECFGTLGATLTATPAFGLSHTLRQVTRRPEALTGWDFSRWRSAIVGAERIDPDLLRRFAEALRPWGFDPDALCPAYGLAESTLAVTGVRPGRPVRTTALPAGPRGVAPAPSPLNGIGDATGLPGATGLPDREDAPASRLVGCGTSIAGAEVRVLDEDGTELPDGRLGTIAVRGPSVARRQLTPGGLRPVTDEDGWLRTGDAGLLRDGELFVVGRRGDALKVRGTTVFAEDVEEAVARRLGEPQYRIAALLGTVGSVDTVIVLIEGRDGAVAGNPATWDAVSTVLRRYVGGDVRHRLFHGPSGCIARTTSGKPRRRLMWRRLTGPEPAGVTEYRREPLTAARGEGAL